MIVEFMGESIEFPDDMSDEDIKKALDQEYLRSLDIDVDPDAASKAVERLAADMSSFDAGLVGAGRTVDKWIQGAKNIYAGVTGDEKAKARLAAREKMKDELYAELADESPVATTVGEIAPFLIGGGSSIPAQMAMGGVQAGLTYDENQGENAAIGAAISGAIPGAGKLYRGLKKGVSRLGPMASTDDMLNRVAQSVDETTMTRRGMNEIADQADFPLSPGERTNNRMLQSIEAGLESLPFTSPVMAAHKQAQKQAVNRMVGEAMGEKGVKEVTEEVLDRAHNRLSREFKRLTIGQKMMPDDEFIEAWVRADDELVEGLFDSKTASTALKRIAQRIDDNKPILDRDYQLMSSQITKKLKSPSLDGDEKQVLGYIKDALDDLVERNLGNDKLARFRKVRGQYKAYKYAAENTDTGNVSGRKIANKLQRRDEAGFTRGRNRTPLYDAARLDRAFKPVINDSGTAPRMLAAGTIAGGASLASGSEGEEALRDALLVGGGSALAAKAYLKGGSPLLANLVNQGTRTSKNLLLDPRFQSLLGRSAVGGYVTNE